ncbi:FHA domain-containing protein [Nocardia sp. ET3-3]|uniref:FHA domain-containing protein n=1 Tax=Nocardia terrae TaxID=2675851 RepID=A0A7K1V321_9NOCA|nr:FHA domain-containing protein [Nocardia terrae]MVU81015.1 FHA domain-containing protein [Nocardia terrae]
MAFCTEGHQSGATDYCDVCGAPMAAGPQTTLCPNCGVPSEGRFCENCGHDSELGAAPVAPPVVEAAVPAETVLNPRSQGATVWVATISADPDHYARMRAQKGPDLERVEFPDYYPERRIALSGNDILIGKRSVSQGIHPDIDLSVAPADVAVSRSHAILHIDGNGVSVTDLGSTNGTCVNDSAQPIPAKTAVPLREGDRIHVGGWTTITLSVEAG